MLYRVRIAHSKVDRTGNQVVLQFGDVFLYGDQGPSVFGQRLGDERTQRVHCSQQEEDGTDQEGFEKAQVTDQRPNENATATAGDDDVLRRNKIKEVFHCVESPEL